LVRAGNKSPHSPRTSSLIKGGNEGGGEWNLDREVRCISMMSRNVANRGSAVILSNLSIDFQFRERARVRSRRTRLLAIFARRSAANEGKAICTRIHAHAHIHTYAHTHTHAHTPRFSTQFRWWGKSVAMKNALIRYSTIRRANEKRRIFHAGRILRGSYFPVPRKIIPREMERAKISFLFLFFCLSLLFTDHRRARSFFRCDRPLRRTLSRDFILRFFFRY